MEKEVVKNLESWFYKKGRKLDWRESPSAYEVLVSEIMLQQTRVNYVKNYYQRWMKKFPTLKKLAQAKLEDVFLIWEGLGYYKRAENLWKNAKHIEKNFNGVIPSEKKELLKLSGIGEYTASAICSFAYRQKIPAIDCNVERVLSRLYFYQKKIQTSQAKKKFIKKAESLLIFGKASIFNQALMELGALICTSKNPKCELCPLQKYCLSYKKNAVEKIPVMRKKAKISQLVMDYWVLQNHKNEFLVCKIKNASWWKNMYVLPYFFTDKKLEKNYFSNITDLLEKSSKKKIGELNHHVTKYKIKANYWLFCEKENKEFFLKLNNIPNKNFFWIKKKELEKIALPRASRHGIFLLEKESFF